MPIAALAYGTESIARVDKIVGPGNRYVAAAKARVSADCAIDFYAGPTEIVIVAGTGRAEWIAADLVAQAEHDPEARSIFITWSASLAARVGRAVARLAEGREIVEQSLSANGVGDRHPQRRRSDESCQPPSHPSIWSSIANR